MKRKKTVADRAYNSAGVVTTIGLIGTVFFLFVLVVYLIEPDPELDSLSAALSLLVCIVPFALMVIFGSIKKKRVKRYRQYIFLITEHRITSIDVLASSVSMHPDFVKKDLQKMIDLRFFDNANIDYIHNEIIIGGFTGSYPPQFTDYEQGPMLKYTCSGCGASCVKQANAICICEYCGAVIK